jgi:UDP-sugar diphosphatase
MGGFARLATLIEEIRQQKSEVNEPVALFSAGDFTGGPAFAWLALKNHAAELDLMQRMGYDAVVPGNHEFDFGTKVLSNYLKNAGYPAAHEKTTILGTNFRIPADHPLNEIEIHQTSIKTLSNGLKIGMLGLIGEDAVAKTAFPEPVEFENYLEAARRAVAELNNQEVDVIIAITHSGEAEDRILAREVEDIDLIIGGHFHTPIYEPIIEGNTIIAQAGSYTRYLGKLELNWLPGENRLELRNPQHALFEIDDQLPEHREIAERLSYYESELNQLLIDLTQQTITDYRQTIAVSDFTLSRKVKQESAIGNFITDAMRIETGKFLGEPVDVAVQANGAIRGNIEPGSMPWSDGEITFYDLITTTGLGSGPDGNPGYPLVAFYLTGDEIRRAMEISILLSEMLMDNYFLQFSGAAMNYDPSRALWLTVPLIDQPVPSSKAVLDAQIYTGSGIQGSGEMKPLEKGDTQLYHIVTDYYIAGFLPMVGELLPGLMVQFKDRDGNFIELNDAIILQNGRELKVWQTVVNYAMSFRDDETGNSKIPDDYKETGKRLIEVDAQSLWFWPVASLVLILILIGTVFLIYKRRKVSAGSANT